MSRAHAAEMTKLGKTNRATETKARGDLARAQRTLRGFCVIMHSMPAEKIDVLSQELADLRAERGEGPQTPDDGAFNRDQEQLDRDRDALADNEAAAEAGDP